MKRRQFIKSSTILLGAGATGLFNACNLFGKQKLKFAISTDIHKGFMHDADERVTAFLKAAQEEQVEFIMDLGDFCHPKEENQSFVDIWQANPLPKFHALGNHDMDFGTKEDFLNFIGFQKAYYSFDQGDFHFIVLDPNNLFIDGEYIPYQHANFYKPAKQRAFVDSEQLEWLKKDLKETDKHCLVFSHQSFENPKACQNQKTVRAIFEAANKQAGFQKVVACFSGHDHTDYVKEINGIQYIQINSMSYTWLGSEYKCPERFSEEVLKKYPALQNTATYQKPLYAIVTIEDGVLTIDGVDGSFVQPGPETQGLTDGMLRGLPLSASISDAIIPLKTK
jgi:predicted phosphodiesterase